MKFINGNWYDDDLNMWTGSKNTRKEAEEQSRSLENCERCVDCHNLVDCVECKGCHDLERCVGCGFCADSSDLEQCDFCDNCSIGLDLTLCVGCSDCRSCMCCHECDRCVNAENKRNCVDFDGDTEDDDQPDSLLNRVLRLFGIGK